MSDIQARIRIGDGGVEGFNQFTLSPGYTTNEDTPYEMQQAPITNLTGQDQNATYHDSDDGPPEIINLEENNRVWRFTLKVDAGSKTGNLNALSTLKRHVSGKQSTAYQSYRNGSQEPVWFDIRLDSESLWTSFRIMRGVVDDGQSFYTTAADINDKALSCLVVLTCVPAGRGETIELRNDLPSSPHMIEDSNGDGLSDGLSLLSTPTVDRVSIGALTGGLTQRFITDDTNSQGVETALVSASAGDSVVGYVDLRVDPGDDVVSVVLLDGNANSIDDVKIDPADPTANASNTFVSNSGLLMYRIEVSGSLIANDCSIRILRSAGFATTSTAVYIDKIYLQTGTDIMPSGFCSSSSLKNRYDPTNTSAATRQQINYLDVWGVPGDMPALVDMAIAGGGDSPAEDGFIASSLTAGKEDVTEWAHLIDSADSILDGGATISNAARIGGSFQRFTSTGALSTVDPIGGATGAYQGFGVWLASVPTRVYAIARTTDRGSDMYMSWTVPGVVQNDSVKFNDVDTWELVDLGLLNATTSEGSSYVMLDINAVIATGNIDIDAIVFLPISSDGLLIVPPSMGVGLAPYFTTWADGKTVRHTRSISLTSFAPVVPFTGGLWYMPSEKTTRLVFSMVGSYSNGNDAEYEIDTEMSVGLSITPMASHLLGTSSSLAPSQLPA